MIYEKLYLDKSKNVFFDEEITSKLKQFQIDGLRFIYGQYNRQAPGIILNDPAGSGRSVQIILFLKATKVMLQQPALILCNNVEKFQQLFCDWKVDCSDVILNSQTAFVNKKIFVNTWEDLNVMSRREWSIVVVYNDDCSVKFVKQLHCLKATFKIVVVTANLKRNIPTFFTIYDWISPNHHYNIEDFLPKGKSIKEFVDKAILVDYLFEDKVLARNDAEAVPQSHKREIKTTSVAVPKVSRKNKDPTGTKVKRSRKRVDIDDIAHDSINKIVNDDDPNTSNILNKLENTSTATNVEDDNIMNTFETYVTKSKVAKKRKLVIESDSDEKEEQLFKFKSKTDSDSAVTITAKTNPSTNDIISITNTDIHIDDSIINENKDLTKNIKKEVEIENIKAEEEKSIELQIKNEVTDDINTSQNDINTTISEDLFSNLDEHINKMNKSNEIQKDEINDVISAGKTNICDKDHENNDVEIINDNERNKSFDEVNCSQFDNKIKKLENDAVKKFKGSFLDSIF